MTAAKIRNVGPKSAAWLRQVGVRTYEDLVEVGALATFLKVKRAGFRPSLNLLYALAGALADCHWTDLPDQDKQTLLDDLAAAESDNPILTRWQKAEAASERLCSDTTAAIRNQQSDTDGVDSNEDAGSAADEDGLSRFD
ncbi:MAG: TfoX/Sxy family DNA transformation protein [Rhodanobacteraceae bacterium]